MSPAGRQPDRVAILRAAQKLIGHGDEGGTSIENILREAGVNRRIFYRHFATKNDLIIAMQDWFGQAILDDLRAAVEAAGNPTAAVVAWIEHYLSIGWDAVRFRDARTFLAPEVASAAGIATALEATYARHREVLEGALAAGCDDGSLPNARPGLDAFAIHAVAVRHLEARIRGRLESSLEDVRDQIVELFLTALTSAPARMPTVAGQVSPAS